jgi:uncharacterized protein (DUF885 family)
MRYHKSVVAIVAPFRLAAICCLTALAQAGTMPADPTVSPMRGVIDNYTQDLAGLDRRYQLPGSDAEHQRLAKFFQDRLDGLSGVNFDSLDQAGKVDYLLLQNRIRFEVRELEYQKKQFDLVATLLPFAEPIVALEESRRRMEKLDSENAARTLVGADSSLAKLRKDLEAKVKSNSKELPDKVLANRAAKLTDQLREVLEHWHAFYDQYDPQFSWWMREPYPKFDKALKDYAEFLRKKLAGYTDEESEPVIGDPIGRVALLDALQLEMIPYTPEELIEIAQKEFAWCDVEMKRASRDLGFGDDWHKAVDHVAQHHVAPGDQPQLIKQLADEAVKFVDDHDLVTIPPICRETWRMEMMSPQRQKIAPYFLGGEVIQVSYPTDTMSDQDKLMSMRGNNYAFCRATVFHELIPGHHLQIFMSQHYNAHRHIFQTPFLIEGWALYWEMRFWDMGFARTPEERVGMLFWRAHRCARIIFSLKFHLGQMTAQQAIDFLVDRVGHERRNATAEVRRSVSGDYGPLYQCAYMLGALQLRALHLEVVDAGKMKDRDFNDAVLRENAIPVEMIRASLTGQPLTRDFKSTWRFYESSAHAAN